MFKKVIKMNLLGKEALQDLFPGILIFLLIIAGYVNQVNANGEIPIVGAVYFFFMNAQETGVLFPETETQFYGTSKEIGDFQANFFKDKKGEIKHFIVQVGFGKQFMRL